MNGMGSRLLGISLAALAPLCSSCAILEQSCTTEARAGINIEVRDSVTSAPAATGAIATARDGIFTDTLMSFDGLSRAGAWERPGNYVVSITKAGYRQWSASGVQVTDGGCHVRPVILQARLQPA